MEPADFAVRIEEIMAEECTSYECVLVDEEQIGILWTFLIEDTITGYLGIEDNEETLNVRTVSVGLHLKDITGISREELMELFELNGELINANFSVVKFPAKQSADEEQEPVFVDEGEDLIYDDDEDENEEAELHDLLIIQTRLPFDAFSPDDFGAFIQNLLFQADTMLNKDKDEEEDDEE